FSTPFQSPEFYDFFNSLPHFSAEVFALAEKGEIRALCVVVCQKEAGIKGYFSRRAIIYGGPLLVRKDQPDLEHLLEGIEKYFRHKAIYTEFRLLHDYHLYSRVFQSRQWEYLPYLNYRVDCSDRAEMFKKLSNNRKRQIKKALRSGVQVKPAETAEEVKLFYVILKELYQKKIRKPLPSEEFFMEFFRRTLGKIFLVAFDNRIIGGIVCPELKGRCIYEYYVCGLDDQYREQSPSVMATWAAMEYAAENHIPAFDFMGAGRKDRDYGVREFKSRFGGERVEYGRYIKINQPVLYQIGKAGLSFMKLLSR
ncbi:MAG: lipid II:glycine glycyltransferase FemX, partial [Bacteroidales bacterium]